MLATALGAWAGFRAHRALAQAASSAPATQPPVRLRFPAPVQPMRVLPSFEATLRVPGDQGLMASLVLDGREKPPPSFVARPAEAPLLRGLPTLMWSFEVEHGGRQLRNPLLRVRSGAAVKVRLDNQLGEETTIHWHGLSVDELNDGSGLHPVRPH